MDEICRLKLWHSFTEAHSLLDSSVPLFAISESGVDVFPYGSDRRPMLKRSSAMDDLLKKLALPQNLFVIEL
jgi:hypothetical protein